MPVDSTLILPAGSTSTLGPGIGRSSSNVQSTQPPPSKPSQTSSARPLNTPANPSHSTNSPVASFSDLSSPSSTPSKPTSAPNDPATSSTMTFTTTSLLPSQSQASSQTSTGTSLIHNKPAMIAIFASAGFFVLVGAMILGMVVVRRQRRKNLIKSALDFTPTTDHLINNDDYGSGATLGSRGSGSSTSDVQSIPASVPSIYAPTSIYAPSEMQQRGPGIDYVDNRGLDREVSRARYAYGSQQRPPSSLPRWQLQDEGPLPTDVGPIPRSLIPSSQRGSAVFDVPFATTVTKPPPRGSYDARGGDGTRPLFADTRERRQTTQVRLPPPPPPRSPRRSPPVPNTPGRDDERWEDAGAVVDKDRVLKVVNG